LNLALMLFTANYRTVHTWYRTRLSTSGRSISRCKAHRLRSCNGAQRDPLGLFCTPPISEGDARRGAERDVAMLMGINPDRVFLCRLGVALALAGAAGSLLMPFFRPIHWSARCLS